MLLLAAATEAAPWGPLLSGVSSDGFAVTVGDPDGEPQGAELQVFSTGALASDPPLSSRRSAPAHWHLLRADGLQPERRYRYRVLLGGQPVAEAEVSTAPPVGAPRQLLVAVFGDERSSEAGVSPLAPELVRAVLAERPDLVLGTGDLVTRGGDLLGWRQLMRSHGPLLAQVPYYPALGNHELIDDPTGRTFRTLFPQAARGHYAVRHGQLLVLLLDGNRAGDGEQARFLDEELGRAAGDAGVRWRLVVLHHSPFSVSAHCGLAQKMASWIERFERYRVDAVISGHDHSYQRLERNGVAYFVSGGGGAPLYPQSLCAVHDHAAVQRYEAEHHYLLVRLEPGRDSAITVIARTPAGRVLDQVTLPLQHAALAPPLELAPAEVSLRPGAERPLARSPWLLLAFALVAGIGVLWLRRRRAGGAPR